MIMTHAFWWALFIIYELSIFYYSAGTFGNFLRNLGYYGINISLFYAHLYLLNKCLGQAKKKYFRLLYLVSAELVLFVSIKIAIDIYTSNFNMTPENMWNTVKSMATLDLYRCIFFIGLSSLFWTASNISNFERKALITERDALTLETKLARSENALLRQQINPHLLFNSLNFIHSTVYKVSEAAAENVILLADILRFSLEDTGSDGKIFLDSEIEQLHNLVRINQLRFGQKSIINFITTGEKPGYRIIPLVLMTLVENIFKHGDLSGPGTVIRLEVSEAGLLRFYTRNKCLAKSPYPRLKSIGLANIRIRLDFAYGGKYSLSSKEEDGIYESELTLSL